MQVRMPRLVESHVGSGETGRETRESGGQEGRRRRRSFQASMYVQPDAGRLFHTDFTRSSASSQEFFQPADLRQPLALLLRLKLECRKNASVIPDAFQTDVCVITDFTV